MDKLKQIEKLAHTGFTQKEIVKFLSMAVSDFHHKEPCIKAYNKGIDKRQEDVAAKVEKLAEVGFSQVQIAEHIGHRKQILIRGKYRENYLRGHHRMKERLRSEMLKICFDEKTSMPKVRMLEFVAKNLLNWSDRVTQVKDYDYDAIYSTLHKAAEKDPAVIDQFQQHIQGGGDPYAFFNGEMGEA